METIYLISRDTTKAEALAAESRGRDAMPEAIRVLENTPDIHNVVVCTLCSCYPWPVLGLPPTWYKSYAYRSRVVREPRAVLHEFGLDVPDSVEVRVWDSNSEIRYMVLPERPGGTDNWDEAQLAALVTRDSMIGTAIPGVPARPTARKRKAAA